MVARRAVQLVRALVPWVLGLVVDEVRVRLRRSDRSRVRARRAGQLRVRFERLGGAYLKFGQILAMRPDFLPAAYVAELGRLLDRVPAFDSAQARRIVERELDGAIDELFAEFAAEPVASASFGQVYRARLPSGELVAVKVQRPGVRAVVRADLRILRVGAWLVDVSTVLMTLKVKPLYDDFRAWTWEELDYRVEARYASRMATSGSGTTAEAIPRIYWDRTTERVLTLEFFDGIWLNDVLAAIRDRDPSLDDRLAECHSSREELGATLLTIMLREAFVGGIFHADPHAGNLVLLRDGRVGLVDFGIVGMMNQEFQSDMLRFLTYTSRGLAGRAFQAAMNLIEVPSTSDLRAFRFEYEANLQSWINAVRDPNATLSERSNTRLLLGNLGVMRRYHVRLPPMVLRYYRAFIIVDTIVIQLAPGLQILDLMKAVFTRIQYERAMAQLSFENYVSAYLQYQVLAISAPSAIADLVEGRLRTLEQDLMGTPRRFAGLLSTFSHGLSRLWLLVTVVVVLAGGLGLASSIRDAVPVGWPVLALITLALAVATRWWSRRLVGEG
jgi:ubiquinone biosynthesis protein